MDVTLFFKKKMPATPLLVWVIFFPFSLCLSLSLALSLPFLSNKRLSFPGHYWKEKSKCRGFAEEEGGKTLKNKEKPPFLQKLIIAKGRGGVLPCYFFRFLKKAHTPLAGMPTKKPLGFCKMLPASPPCFYSVTTIHTLTMSQRTMRLLLFIAQARTGIYHWASRRGWGWGEGEVGGGARGEMETKRKEVVHPHSEPPPLPHASPPSHAPKPSPSLLDPTPQSRWHVEPFQAV